MEYRQPTLFLTTDAYQTMRRAIPFHEHAPNPDMKKIVDNWAEKPKKNIYIHGVSGNGKTTLLRYTYQNLVYNRRWVRYVNLQDLIEEVITKNSQGIETPAIIQPFLDCDYLILDDIGSEEKIIPYGQSTFRSIIYPIVDARFEASPVFATLISSNQSMKELCQVYAEKDPHQAQRFYSRLSNHKKCDEFHFQKQSFRTQTGSHTIK